MGYFGSKATSGLCQPIIAMMPPHDTYIETHLGGGAIMKRKAQRWGARYRALPVPERLAVWAAMMAVEVER